VPHALATIIRSLAAGLVLAAAVPMTVVPASADDTAPAAKTDAAIPVVGAGVSVSKLDNGMDVVVIPDHRAPVVTHMVWYRVGAADEPAGRSGIAHFLEHLMFKGTTNHPTGEFSARVAEIGGQENAFTSNDYTAYYQRVAKQHLAEMMAFESDRMANLILTDEVVLPERDVILEERAQRVDNDPSARLGEALDAALFVQHPYSVPIIGWKHEVESLSRDDAIAFYNRYYSPNNAILIVAGDVEADEVMKLARETYGKLPVRVEQAARVRPGEPDVMSERMIRLADPQVSQPNVRQAWVVPSYTTAKPGEAEALDVLAEVLGGGSTSRLYRALVVEKGLAASSGAWFQSSALDDTQFMAYAVPRKGVSLDALTSEIDATIAAIAEKGITSEELDRAKRTLVSDVIYSQDSQATLARIFGVALTTGGSVERVQSWPARISAVTAEQVQAAAKSYLASGRAVTAELVAPADQPKS